MQLETCFLKFVMPNVSIEKCYAEYVMEVCQLKYVMQSQAETCCAKMISKICELKYILPNLSAEKCYAKYVMGNL